MTYQKRVEGPPLTAETNSFLKVVTSRPTALAIRLRMRDHGIRATEWIVNRLLVRNKDGGDGNSGWLARHRVSGG